MRNAHLDSGEDKVLSEESEFFFKNHDNQIPDSIHEEEF
jgi:hypothetical protein